jgi:NAD(P)-dependent dehydrogenase (short-subunit alcohol dehydrogenase family)
MGVYHASKAAVKMLTMCMATEWAPYNILVNAVGPGLTRTHFSQPIWSNPEVERQIVTRIPMGRLAEPEDIVGAVLFLCSDAARFITGQTIYVDGGTLANT